MSGVELRGVGASYALQCLAREQMKTKLLADINTDMMICQLEGWDVMEYVRGLHDAVAHFTGCEPS